MTHISKTLLCSVAGILSALSISSAEAAMTNLYAGISGDATWLRHSDIGGGGNAELGYHFGDMRLEAQAGYHGASGDNGYSSNHYFTYMGNAYYDFNTLFSVSSMGWKFSPYIGGGVGDAQIHTGNSSFTTTFHDHNNEFAYQGMLGFNISATPSTTWNLGYRYLGTNNHNLHANNVELGVKYNF